MSTPHTKERIFDAAGELMWKKSFHSVGLNEILTTVGVPKGSFYHYFESKEHFGVEMLKHYIQAATVEKKQMLLSIDGERDPLQRLLDMLTGSIELFQEEEGKCPCLVLKLASEVTDLSEPMREELAKGMNVWLGILSAVFSEAVVTGRVMKGTDPDLEARVLRDLWAGAIQRATIMKSKEPMETALAFICRHFANLAPSQSKRRLARN